MKSRRIHTGPCGFNFAKQFRLIFDKNAFHDALLTGAGVIHTYLLTSPQRGRHDRTGAIDNARGRAEREAHRAFRAANDDGFAGLVRGHGASRVRGCLSGRGRVGCGCCGSFRCACARLRERDRCDHRASESDHYSFHCHPPLFVITSSPWFVAWGPNGRLPSAAVESLTGTGTEVFDRIHVITPSRTNNPRIHSGPCGSKLANLFSLNLRQAPHAPFFLLMSIYASWLPDLTDSCHDAIRSNI